MLYVTPQSVIDLLNEQSGALLTAANVPSSLPDAEASCTCPRCGSVLAIHNQYVGGRGYLPYAVCAELTCDYQRRVN